MSMFKSVKVNYPKKKVKVNDMRVIGVPEPDRKTMYDIVLENFQIAGRKTFLQRIIYIGEHCFVRYDGMVNFFTETINGANHHRRILIKYQRHFIHFLEGDEDAIYEHIKLLLKHDQYGNVLENLKLLAIIHHINCRYATEWTCMSGNPPQLLEKIDPNSSIEVAGSVTYGCILKLYDILEKLIKINSSTPDLDEKFAEDTDGNLNVLKPPGVRESLLSTSSAARRYSFRFSKLALETTGKNTTTRSKSSYADPLLFSLPEIDTLHFLINTPHTKKIKDVLQLYSQVEQRDIYKDKVWPIAADFIPYDVYSKGYDISTVFPKPDAKPSRRDTTVDGISILLWEAEEEDAEIKEEDEE
ncbi:uncharacterized protein LOC130895399 isoform X2 [Diorhabda carinulata]|uniref:uncharacterized protein LOC130895399 isoform X2 n=1 Tax=Diorhabda carinulata TaxID=1163345 RepID=UPI00259FF521|nr:uncharacterized protein LOC130895399 isoform X2 [Diorhabda carinulata]